MQPADSSLAFPVGQLPDELLIAIVTQLEVRRGFLADPELEAERQRDNAATVQALHTLTLTCQKLHYITTPALYQCVIQSQYRVWTTKLLLQTLSCKPQLSRYIHYVESHSCPNQLRLKLHQYYTESDRKSYERLLAQAKWTVPYIDDPFSDVDIPLIPYPGDDIDTAQRALWDNLSITSRVEPLEFAVATLIALAENLSDAALSFTQSFYSILACKQYPVNGGLKCAWFKDDFLARHSIRIFKAKGSPLHNALATYLRLHSFHITSEPKPELEEISLHVVDLREMYVWRTLSSCRAVKHFGCHWISTDFENPYDENRLSKVDLPALREELDQWKTTFESLTIDTMDSSWLVDMDVDIPAFGTFRDFTSLKQLEVSSLVIWGDCDNVEYPRLSNILPDSLETLSIQTEWDDDVEDALHNLCEDRSTMLLQLRRVKCTWRPAPKATADYLIEAFLRLGVELVLNIEESTDSKI